MDKMKWYKVAFTYIETIPGCILLDQEVQGKNMYFLMYVPKELQYHNHGCFEAEMHIYDMDGTDYISFRNIKHLYDIDKDQDGNDLDPPFVKEERLNDPRRLQYYQYGYDWLRKMELRECQRKYRY